MIYNHIVAKDLVTFCGIAYTQHVMSHMLVRCEFRCLIANSVYAYSCIYRNEYHVCHIYLRQS